MKKRKICVVTGSRAEYGLLSCLMKEIREDREMTLQIIATGAHLAPEFGNTYRAIEADGFRINAKVPILNGDTSALGVLQAIGTGVQRNASAE